MNREGLSLGLFDEVNPKKSRMNARHVLSRYRLFARMANRQLPVNIKSPSIDGMPKAPTVQGGGLEDRLIREADRQLEAQRELNIIIDAVNALNKEEQLTIYYTYMTKEKEKDLSISRRIYDNNVSLRTMQNVRDRALMKFCEAYKGGVLLVFEHGMSNFA